MSIVIEMSELTVCREVYGSSQVSKKYVKSRDDQLVVVDLSPKWTSVSQFFRSVFLPQGYPDSVSSDYLTYQVWDTIQAFASSITGTLAAQAVLKGVGVGDENATVLAATLTWILKDGTGMLGRIIFAWMQGSSLDYDAKRWRLFADILNDFAIFTEIMAPNFPHLFTPIVCTAGVCKAIVGVAGGATRAALTQHQARRNNMADVSAKDGSQETLVNLAALLCSLSLIPIITGRDALIWFLYTIFTGLHLYANYSAVTCVVMETLNQARLHIIVQEYLLSGKMLSTDVVNYREPVLWKTRRNLSVHLGESISKLCKSVKDMETLLKIYQDSSYILGLNLRQKSITIVLSQKSSIEDQLQSCFQAEVLSFVYKAHQQNKQISDAQLAPIQQAISDGDTVKAEQISYKYVLSHIQPFIQSLQQGGWLIDPILLGPEEWRATWDPEGLADKKSI